MLLASAHVRGQEPGQRHVDRLTKGGTVINLPRHGSGAPVQTHLRRGLGDQLRLIVSTRVLECGKHLFSLTGPGCRSSSPPQATWGRG